MNFLNLGIMQLDGATVGISYTYECIMDSSQTHNKNCNIYECARRSEFCGLWLKQRQKTLLKEYEQSTKSSTFIDKRIGEQNEGLEEFDKAILRSQRERQVRLLRFHTFLCTRNTLLSAYLILSDAPVR